MDDRSLCSASIDAKRVVADEKQEVDELSTGPLSVLMHSVKQNSQVRF
jgi:hypothetical protein